MAEKTRLNPQGDDGMAEAYQAHQQWYREKEEQAAAERERARQEAEAANQPSPHYDVTISGEAPRGYSPEPQREQYPDTNWQEPETPKIDLSGIHIPGDQEDNTNNNNQNNENDGVEISTEPLTRDDSQTP